MDVMDLKEKIKLDNKIETILKNLNMKSIRSHEEYYSCGMPQGDNPNSTIVYKDSLYVDAHTRDIKDKNGISDIISLVSFVNQTYFSNSIQWVCKICGYDYYGKIEELPVSVKWMRDIMSLDNGGESEEDEYLKPIPEEILDYYGNYCNEMFFEDGISLETQTYFGLGYDLSSHRITIPIRDELGTLVGIKGRLYKKKIIPLLESKYLYLSKCAKTKVLFGLDKTYDSIKEKGLVYVFESEKAVMQMWSYGIFNCVAVGSHKLSKAQSKKLTHLGVDIIFCYDKGIGIIELENKVILDSKFWNNECRNFISGQKIGLMIDKHDILEEKESPSDNFNKFEKLEELIIYNTIRRDVNE